MNDFWNGKKVLVTGHTGFKGSWMCLMLKSLGAQVFGYALKPPTEINLFDIAEIESQIESYIGDITDLEALKNTINKIKPEIIFHLAAQAIVGEGYKDPVSTFSTNVMGTVNLFESVRNEAAVKVIINVTSDKCYENKEWQWGYREIDLLGGKDPYSCSKACAELITGAYRNSFFENTEVKISTVRAGNVIGGGDWAENRIIPDIYRAINENKVLEIRNPYATRPWQHVLEPLTGYVKLAELMFLGDKDKIGAWNFGPDETNVITVGKLVELIKGRSMNEIDIVVSDKKLFEEANVLKLDSSKAKIELDWKQKLSIYETVDWTVDWYDAWIKRDVDIKKLTIRQIENYIGLASK